MTQSSPTPELSPTSSPTPSLGQMFARLWRAEGQNAPARTVELFGWLDLVLGLLILLVPRPVATVLHLPPLSIDAENYIRLVGLLVSGLGTLYIVSGRLNAQGFVFASLLDRPLVPLVMAVLWYLNIIPGPIALAFSISDFGGFLWTLAAWKAEMRTTRLPESSAARIAAGLFGFTSGVVRNSRTFHPDGRVFRGTIHSLNPSHPSLARAAQQLDGCTALMRIGMGLMKNGMPPWLTRIIPDAPSIATRIYEPTTPREIRLIRQLDEDFDLLCTAGGDRLWKLVLNLATGAGSFGLDPSSYFRNTYYADTRYFIDAGKLDVWLRLVPASDTPAQSSREDGLTHAVAARFTIRVEAQPAGHAHEPFIPLAEIRFEEELTIDQEALHFDPVAGRGFVPHGFLTDVRRSVYPASVRSRAATRLERERRAHESLGNRLSRYFSQPPSVPLDQGNSVMNVPINHPWLKLAVLLTLLAVFSVGALLALRFTRDQPFEYTDDVLHFKHGSTGGERTMGIPYWFWVALPELFPEYLPDQKPGRGYKSFGMIYENGDDPRYALPVGVSMRNVRGIDVVYLNCAVCHTGTVRDAPGAAARVVTGMPANTLNLGAFEQFLTTIPLDQKFVPQRMLDQIAAMQNNPSRRIKPPDLINRLIFRYYAVFLMREKMLMLRQRLGFIHAETWGPGRVDTFNAPKALLNFNMKNASKDELMGNADFPSIWNQKPREGMQLHWDGNNTSVNERNLSAAFGTGAYPSTLDARLVLRTANWLLTAKPMSYPYPIRSELAARGAITYQQYCAGCHGTSAAPFRNSPPRPTELVGTVVPIGRIGTDRSRLDSYTYLVAANQSTLYAGYEKDWGFNKPYPQRFSHFHKTSGYANAPLDGIWLRAPYLHNGSVPNLRELLEPSQKRSPTFFRGNDVYDPQNVGFVADVAEQLGTKFSPFNTAAKGNGNHGHEGPAYGTELPTEQKLELLEYLKTF